MYFKLKYNMWFPLSLFFALWTSISLLIVKKMTRKLHPQTILLTGGLFVLPFMFVLVLLTGGIPNVSQSFYKFMLTAGLLDVVAFISSTWAIKLSEISLVAPLAAFGPVFTTLAAAVVLKEIPSLIKFIGIIVIVLGAYLLNLNDIKLGILDPFKKLFSDRGAKLFFFANFIWGLTPILQKQAIFQMSPTVPLFASFFGVIIVILFLIPLSINKVKQDGVIVMNYLWLFIILGLFSSLSQLAAFTAFSLTNLGYSTAIFKLSIFFSVIFGGVFLKEKRFKERVFGAVVMLIGTILLVA